MGLPALARIPGQTVNSHLLTNVNVAPETSVKQGKKIKKQGKKNRATRLNKSYHRFQQNSLKLRKTNDYPEFKPTKETIKINLPLTRRSTIKVEKKGEDWWKELNSPID